MMKRHKALPILAWLTAGSLMAYAADEGRTVRLLDIGNSFSGNATRFLGPIARADGNQLVHYNCFIGGGTMKQHWDKVLAFQKDPASDEGYYPYSRVSLVDELRTQRWDVVTIQQGSIVSHAAATYQPYAGLLCGLVRSNAPQAEIMMLQTWAYRCDDSRFTSANTNADEPRTQEAMYQGLKQAYARVAQELGIRQIPVGDAFHAVDTDPVWGYRPDASFDPATARPRALPDQSRSLHAGWSWQKGTNGVWALKMDGHHANTAGQFLGACVMYESVFGRTVVGNAFRPKGMSRKECLHLQEVAHEAVQAARAASRQAARAGE